MYDTNEDVLVARKSDYQNNNIGDGYYIVPKDEWACENDGIKRFHLYHTKTDGHRIALFLTREGNSAVLVNNPYHEEVIMLKYKYSRNRMKY